MPSTLMTLIYNLVLRDTKNVTNDFLAPPLEITHLAICFYLSVIPKIMDFL